MNPLQARLQRMKSSLVRDQSAVSLGDKALHNGNEIVQSEGEAHNFDPFVDFEQSVSPQMQQWHSMQCHLHEGASGSFIRRRKVYSLDKYHGHYALGEWADGKPVLKGLPNAEGVSLNEMLFFDTETTGLGVGAGNVAFMVGLAFYEAKQFVVEQLFIRDPAEESAMLEYFLTKLAEYRYLISYNGRTFDWPLMRNRFVMNRLYDRLEALERQPVQLDLLYVSRALWRDTLPSCRLSKVEELRLGFDRLDDIPGSEAPAYYYKYLFEQEPEIMQGIFIHNEYDLLSLTVLGIHLHATLLGKTALHALEADELFRTGHWLHLVGQHERSALAFKQLQQHDTLDACHALLKLAAFYKKQGSKREALSLWKKVILVQKTAMSRSIEPYIELAIYYEHSERNFEEALLCTNEALNIAYAKTSLLRVHSVSELRRAGRAKAGKPPIAELRKRAERLGRKLSAL